MSKFPTVFRIRICVKTFLFFFQLATVPSFQSNRHISQFNKNRLTVFIKFSTIFQYTSSKDSFHAYRGFLTLPYIASKEAESKVNETIKNIRHADFMFVLFINYEVLFYGIAIIFFIGLYFLLLWLVSDGWHVGIFSCVRMCVAARCAMFAIYH